MKRLMFLPSKQQVLKALKVILIIATVLFVMYLLGLVQEGMPDRAK